MNLSGPPLVSVLRRSGLPPTSLVVIHDSLSHKPMTISPKLGGSANGHNGIRSIIAALGQNSNFHRLRIGIGRNTGQDAVDYVMAKLSDHEKDFWIRNGKGVDLVWKNIEKIVLSG
ncbi:hypothetical protein EIP91_011585 [Steccherinum ochraceum]|uniref:peptidyl-tRNA hydrolase n=1 Tax=Steccherinum ochraceum TaxID=92696 RepID=A0A4R0RI46_9APHY|nr:hypothetical protein EIP91_011585 [Steccherinum ochraceum]